MLISCSSRLMTNLITWRNPGENEERWFIQPQIERKQRLDEIYNRHIVKLRDSSIQNFEFIRTYHRLIRELNHVNRLFDDIIPKDKSFKQIGKVAIAQCGIACLSLAALIESIIYLPIFLGSLALYLFSNKPYQFIAKLLQSSDYTFLWSIGTLFANVASYSKNLLTHEIKRNEDLFAREHGFESMCLMQHPIEKYLVGEMWLEERPIEQKFLNLLRISRLQPTINHGASFIREQIYPGLSAEHRELFEYVDPFLILFVLTKTVYIYVLGSKRHDRFPDFLKFDTHEQMDVLRQQLRGITPSANLTSILEDASRSEERPENPEDQTLYSRLRGVASLELSDSVFLTTCWQRSIS